MTGIMTGIAGVLVLIVIFLLRMPVGFAMALVGMVGFSLIVSFDAGMNVLARDFFSIFSSYSLTVIPMFTLMGCIASESGMSRRLYDAGYVLFGKFPGGLALASVIGCAGFAAINGSTSATAAAMGKVCIPEMKRYKYDDSLSAGIVAAAGTLGIMIPPSTIFIVYGILTEQSIGKLFVAGIFPGLLIASLLMVTVAILCWRKPSLAPAAGASTFKEKMEALTGIIEMLVLFCFVILGLFFGWFSPTTGWRRWCSRRSDHRTDNKAAELAWLHKCAKGYNTDYMHGHGHNRRSNGIRPFYCGDQDPHDADRLGSRVAVTSVGYNRHSYCYLHDRRFFHGFSGAYHADHTHFLPGCYCSGI